MTLIVGPLFSGKRQVAMELLGCSEAELAWRAVVDAQELAASNDDLQALAEQLATREVVIATEMGGGVVPTDPAQRAAREASGRLTCLLAQKADTVIRVFCGIPTVLKGKLS